MIAECIAVYHGALDMVQVSAIIAEDWGDSLHSMLKLGKIELLQENVPILEKEFVKNDYNEGEEGFYIFFLHPPIQRNMYVKLTVTLRDDRTATKKTSVDFDHEVIKNAANNPMLAGRKVPDYTYDGKRVDESDQKQRRSPL